jgi:S1-C subfamily serine protease
MIRLAIVLLALMAATLGGATAQAQDRAWIQIEAKPTLAGAEDRARAWAGLFDDVSGYRIRSGWYAIFLGPFAPETAVARMTVLKGENLIPRDSFIAFERDLRDMFWPVGASPEPSPSPLAETTPEPTLEPAPAPDETPQQARASERDLTQSDRELLQTALNWFGFYDAAIDGAFGPGTRNSMAEWQGANGFEPTGVLTTMQRATLTANYQADQQEFGFQSLTEAEAGIEITMPLSLVKFDHYEPPFVHFTSLSGSKTSVILISQPGDQASLSGLYDVLQTLELMPLTGERTIDEDSFTIAGENAQISSHAYAQVNRGLVKGFILVWDRADGDRMDRVLSALQSSFRPVGDRALDPGLAPMAATARQGLLSGLEVRTPKFSRTGFFIDTAGTVLTTAEAVAQCGRITLDREVEATVTLTDAATGLAVLRPSVPLSPPATAEFQTAPDRLGAEIAVSGYSYEDQLPAPVLTYGTLAATEGLAGEPGLKRLSLPALPGDAGGPVLDATGAVLGMLLPATTGAKVLPEGVAFAATGSAIAARLGQGGITLAQVDRKGSLSPADLSALASGMTVLVSCWE